MFVVTLNLIHQGSYAASGMLSASKAPVAVKSWICCCACLTAWLLPLWEGFSCKNQHWLPASVRQTCMLCNSHPPCRC